MATVSQQASKHLRILWVTLRTLRPHYIPSRVFYELLPVVPSELSFYSFAYFLLIKELWQTAEIVKIRNFLLSFFLVLFNFKKLHPAYFPAVIFSASDSQAELMIPFTL